MLINTSIKMKFLDSNFLFGYFVKEDALHEKSVKEAKLIDVASCVVLSDVLHEVVSIAAVRHSSDLATQIGESIFEYFSIYSPKKVERKAIWNEFKRLSPHRFSYVDVALYYFAKSKGAEIVTFDKALAKICKN